MKCWQVYSALDPEKITTSPIHTHANMILIGCHPRWYNSFISAPHSLFWPEWRCQTGWTLRRLEGRFTGWMYQSTTSRMLINCRTRREHLWSNAGLVSVIPYCKCELVSLEVLLLVWGRFTGVIALRSGWEEMNSVLQHHINFVFLDNTEKFPSIAFYHN